MEATGRPPLRAAAVLAEQLLRGCRALPIPDPCIRRSSALLLLACALLLASGCQTQYKLIGFSWDEADFPLVIDTSATPGTGGLSDAEVRQAALDAMGAWNAATGRNLFMEGDSTHDLQVEAIEDVAVLRIIDGTPEFVVVISSRHAFSVDPGGESDKYDLSTVLVHEFGHALGLDHPVPDLPFGLSDLACVSPGGSDNVMCPRLKGQVMRSPGPGDLAGFRALYGE